MLTPAESYIVLKLNTGEQLMGVLENETDTHVQILDPMIIRTIPIVGAGREHITANPYCQFTADNVFDIEKKNVIFIKPLLTEMIPHYMRIVQQNENTLALRVQEAGTGGMSREEAIRRIEMLQGIVEAEVEKQEPNWFIEGNDTKH
jgi:hypothetical protein